MMQVYNGVAQCRWVNSYRRFGGAYCPHLQENNALLGLRESENAGNTVFWKVGKI
jgi:hypothetical protein